MQFDAVYCDVNDPCKVDSEWIMKNCDNITTEESISLIHAMLKGTKMSFEKFLRTDPPRDKATIITAKYLQFTMTLKKELDILSQDAKCWYCNSTGCDTFTGNGKAYHADCE